MRSVLATVIGMLAVSLAGCVPSVYPLYTARDLQFDPALVGVWGEDGDTRDSWSFTKTNETTYKLIVTEGKKSAPFEARLLRLGSHRFLDISPNEDGLPDTVPDLFKAGLIAGHIFLKVLQIEPTLKMAFLDPDWVEAHLQQHPDDVAHLTRGKGSIVFTARTPELRAFISKYADNKGAFGEASDLKRRQHFYGVPKRP